MAKVLNRPEPTPQDAFPDRVPTRRSRRGRNGLIAAGGAAAVAAIVGIVSMSSSGSEQETKPAPSATEPAASPTEPTAAEKLEEKFKAEEAALEIPTSTDPTVLAQQSDRIIEHAYRSGVIYGKSDEYITGILGMLYTDPVLIADRLRAVHVIADYYKGGAMELDFKTSNREVTATPYQIDIIREVSLDVIFGDGGAHRLTQLNETSFRPGTLVDPRIGVPQPGMVLTRDVEVQGTYKVVGIDSAGQEYQLPNQPSQR